MSFYGNRYNNDNMAQIKAGVKCRSDPYAIKHGSYKQTGVYRIVLNIVFSSCTEY